MLDKLFSIQAIANVQDVLSHVQDLLRHPAFDIKNPNKVSALLGQFSRANPYYFHQKEGRGYAFLQKVILELDALNPQVAARIAQVFTTFKRYDKTRQDLMRQCLLTMQQTKLSNDLYEIVNKTLNE